MSLVPSSVVGTPVPLAVVGGKPISLIVSSIRAEAIKSLPHVFVSNLPNDNVAWWTLKAAVAGVVIGLLTLAAVGWQIWLAVRALNLAGDELSAANNTLKLAGEELELTTKTLDATNASNTLVRESLDYARKQSEYLFRRADLRLYVNQVVLGAPLAAQVSFDKTRSVTFYIANNGDNSARGASVQLLLPPGLYVALNQVAMREVWMKLEDWCDGNGKWAMYERQLPQTFFARSVQSGFELLLVHAGVTDSPIRWRLLYDDGITPEDMPFAPLTTMQSLDRTNIIASVPPPVA